MELKKEIIAFIRGSILIPKFYKSVIEYFSNNKLINLGGVLIDKGAFALLARELSNGRIKSFKILRDKIIVNDYSVDITKSNLSHSTLLLSAIYNWNVHENYVEKNGIKLKSLNYSAIEIFEYGIYNVIDVKNREVVDIGANIGDSTIFFTLKGAKEVIGLEPLPDIYKEAIENVKLNELKNITLINAAIGSKKGKIKVPCNLGSGNSGSFNVSYTREEKCEVNIITLSEILPDDPYLLKMDCEGCEEDVILNSYDDVVKFQNLLFEMHFKGKKERKILEKLNSNFECRKISNRLYLCEKK
ncbi:FkbM family methyltransferase [Sulfolobus sp. S-194]|uniref:FkbM family methyltransferase n=1 Tax=Sulfolobus sp. S-194 TaxID=2512240 RepID=UPI00143738D2|nr:FkbM family methyltransferase [Sulfolobus sp. S-194]QIW24507.1 FkbM family methyltransferase [Sulfolobus sp. S-194]